MNPVRRLTRRLLTPVLGRWYRHWNRSTHRVRVDGFDLVVRPGVFHPALFTSTRLLAEEVASRPLAGRTVLDLGTGAGRIALTAARAGAVVTAGDVNPAAVDCARENALRNKLPITAVVSDLFEGIVGEHELIAINPPFYPLRPTSTSEQAFYTGVDHAYFSRLFPELARRIMAGSTVLMVLSEDIDLSAIRGPASLESLTLDPLRTRVNWGERTTVFEVVQCSSNAPRG